MYELKNGSARLVATLERYQEDDYKIRQLAAVLNYEPQQLRDDIQALSDYYNHRRKK